MSSRSDSIKPRGDVVFRPVGVGMHMTMRCAKCGKDIPNLGRKWQLVRGVKQWVGTCCQVKKEPA